MPAAEDPLPAGKARLRKDHNDSGRKRCGRQGCCDRQIKRYVVIGREVFQVVFPQIGVGEKILEET